MTEFSMTTTVNAPKERVWDPLARFGEISTWNPGVVESHSTTEATGGLGAERRCDLGSGNWVEERVVGWSEGKSLDIQIIDTNAPLSHATVSIAVGDAGDGTSVVDLHIKYGLKYGPVGAVMDLLMARRAYRKAMSDLLAGLKYHAETGEPVGSEIPVATAS